LGLKLTADWS